MSVIGPFVTSRPDDIGYNPATDSSVVEWLKADGITGLTDGQLVTTWQHTTGQDATGAVGFKPTYHTNIKNGLPAVLWNNAQFLTTASFGTLTQPYAVWVVFKCSDNAATYFLTDGTTANRAATFLDQANSAFAAYAGSTADVTAQDANWHILYVLFNGASSKWAIDGGAQQTINTGTNTFDGITLGGNQAQTLSLNGYIGEVIVQNATPANVPSIFTYLDARWAVY